MKTLDQLEARIPIPKSPQPSIAGPHFTITQPGSYYLTGNIDVTTGNGINIEADDVTLDLNGYTISSNNPTAANYGISLNGTRKRVSISNGHIRSGATFTGNAISSGPGFYSGINWSTASPIACRISGISVTGVPGEGITVGSSVNNSSIVEACTVRDVGGIGIRAGVVSNCSVTNAASTSIAAERVMNSVGARQDGTGTGIVQGGASLEAIGAATDKRTQIPGGTATVTIGTPGSYVLMGNLTVATGNGILINASDVSLDLNGFTIASTSPTASGDAIGLGSEVQRISISNGAIRSGTTYSGGVFSNGPGFDSGINWRSLAPRSVQVSGVSITGIRGYGIDLGSDQSSIVQACSVRIAGTIGIRAGVVTDSSVTTGPSTTISAARIANSVGARADGSGTGLDTQTPSFEAIATTTTTTQAAVTTIQSGTTALVAAKDNRTPITSLPFSISTSGSYYLQGNLQHTGSGNAITVSANDVTIDLNGFTLASAPGASGSAVNINFDAANVTVKNGTIAGSSTFTGDWTNEWSITRNGFSYGILNDARVGSRFHNLTIRGCRTSAIWSGGPSQRHSADIDQVSCQYNGSGISAPYSRVSNCVVAFNDGFGINAQTISNCQVTYCNSYGIESSFGTVTDCFVSAVEGAGIKATTVTNCTVRSTGDAITACTVTGSTVQFSGGIGITISLSSGGVISGCCVLTATGGEYSAPGAVRTGCSPP
jgi:hypothetical protein